MTRLSYLFSGLLVASLALPALAEPTNFGQGTQIGRVADAAELSPRARQNYRTFRKQARYFGAFAAHPTRGASFYVFNFHDTQKARAAAIEGCNQLAEAKGCELVAVAMPESLPLGQSIAKGLSEEASDALETVYLEHREPGRYAAFAISGSSHYGYANAWDTAAFAKDTALAYCARGVAADMAEIGPLGRDYAQARGLDTCRVIKVERQPQ